MDLSRTVYALCRDGEITGFKVSDTMADAEELLHHMATLPIKIDTESLEVKPVTVAELFRQRGHYA